MNKKIGATEVSKAKGLRVCCTNPSCDETRKFLECCQVKDTVLRRRFLSRYTVRDGKRLRRREVCCTVTRVSDEKELLACTSQNQLNRAVGFVAKILRHPEGRVINTRNDDIDGAKTGTEVRLDVVNDEFSSICWLVNECPKCQKTLSVEGRSARWVFFNTLPRETLRDVWIK